VARLAFRDTANNRKKIGFQKTNQRELEAFASEEKIK
jgi:hypothetical protein